MARALASICPLLDPVGVTIESRQVNGQPGAIFSDRDHEVLFALTIDILDGQIQAVRSVNNPDKLAHLGPVADARAVLRAASQARRPAH